MTTVNAIVLDISVAAKWFLRDETMLAEADNVLADFGRGMLRLYAPVYFLDEAANIFRTAARRGRIAVDDARRQHVELTAIGISLIESTAPRRAAALDIALRFDIAYYDALYLHVAQEFNLPLLTADYPFFRRAVSAFPSTTYLDSR